jgi:hypothetical protein
LQALLIKEKELGKICIKNGAHKKNTQHEQPILNISRKSCGVGSQQAVGRNDKESGPSTSICI